MLGLCGSLELKLDEVNALYSALLESLWEGKGELVPLQCLGSVTGCCTVSVKQT